MKTKIIILSVLASFIYVNTFAQKILFNLKDGTTKAYPTTEISSIEFGVSQYAPSRSMILNKADGQKEEYKLTDIQSTYSVDSTLTAQQDFGYYLGRMYYWTRAKFFGREDPALYIEASTDLFQNCATNYTYGMQLTRCTSPETAAGIRGVWDRGFYIINNANIIINNLEKAEKCDGVSEADKTIYKAEARFLRAYYYWWISEYFGDTYLSTNEIELNPSSLMPIVRKADRTDLTKIYDEVIIPDLKIAAEDLPIQPSDNNPGHASKKAAQALLARVLLSRAQYDDGTQFYQQALDEANKMLVSATDLESKYGVKLYDTYDEIWQAKNNKNNTEFLWVNDFYSDASKNADSKPNRLHMYYANALNSNSASYPQMPGIGSMASWNYPKPNALIEPTYYFLKLWKDWDARYAADFKENYPNGTGDDYYWVDDESRLPNLQLPEAALNALKANGNFVPKDGQVYEITKEERSDEYKLEMAKKGVAVIDINAIYDTSKKTSGGGAPLRNSNATYGDVKSTAMLSQCWPGFNKFRIWDGDEDGTILLGAANGQFGFANAVIMRFAEVPLIAAECAYRLGKGTEAQNIIKNWIRTDRVVAVGHNLEEAQADIPGTGSDVNTAVEWIMEERARELCGEYLRWFDMKRVYGHQGKFAEIYKLRNPCMAPDGNKDADCHQEYNKYWPIPATFRNQLVSPATWQNYGYDGYDGYTGWGGNK